MQTNIFDWNAVPVKPTKVGEVRQFFQAPTATLAEIRCHATTLNPGEASHAAHEHSDEELIIVKEGTITFLVDGEEKQVGAGSIIFQAPNEIHGMRNAGDVPATYYVLRWMTPGMAGQQGER